MTRAALYARYSEDKQSEASIEDQFRLCREHAGRERWQIVGSYEDAAISGAVRAYVEETNRLNHQRRAQHDVDRRALAKIERAIAGIFSAIEDGMYQPSMKARMDELERQKVEITARTAEAPADVPDVYPNVATNYSRNVASFAEALNDPDGGRQAAEALRSLIGQVILTPGEKRGEVHAELRGELMGILGIAAIQPNERRTQVMTAVVAGPRNQIYPRYQMLMRRPPGRRSRFQHPWKHCGSKRGRSPSYRFVKRCLR